MNFSENEPGQFWREPKVGFLDHVDMSSTFSSAKIQFTDLILAFKHTALGEWLLASAMPQFIFTLFVFLHQNWNFTTIIRNGFKKKLMRCGF